MTGKSDYATSAAHFTDPAVKAAFAAMPANRRAALMALRQLIIAAAAATPQIGALAETLKWGEPAYLPKKPRTGTTLRINAVKGSADQYAMFVHCQTSLVETFTRHYPGVFSFEGNRALVFRAGDKVPEAALKHCIALALTYHLKAQG